jgi:hypothetical protein
MTSWQDTGEVPGNCVDLSPFGTPLNGLGTSFSYGWERVYGFTLASMNLTFQLYQIIYSAPSYVSPVCKGGALCYQVLLQLQ